MPTQGHGFGSDRSRDLSGSASSGSKSHIFFSGEKSFFLLILPNLQNVETRWMIVGRRRPAFPVNLGILFGSTKITFVGGVVDAAADAAAADAAKGQRVVAAAAAAAVAVFDVTL